LGKDGFIRKANFRPPSTKSTVPLVIVNDGLVVKLCRTDTKAVVAIGRSQQKPVIFQKGLDQLVILRRRLSEHCRLWVKVQPTRQLGERSFAHQLLEMPIDSIRPLGQVLAPIDPTRP
jgi:hypothetical protein